MYVNQNNGKLKSHLYKLSTCNKVCLSRFRCRCDICAKREIEDKFHYALVCPEIYNDHCGLSPLLLPSSHLDAISRLYYSFIFLFS